MTRRLKSVEKAIRNSLNGVDAANVEAQAEALGLVTREHTDWGAGKPMFLSPGKRESISHVEFLIEDFGNFSEVAWCGNYSQLWDAQPAARRAAEAAAVKNRRRAIQHR